jgi:hypothetical protein
MKKFLTIAAIVSVLVALIWFSGAHYLNSTAATAAQTRWPNNLGTADDIARHFPSHGDNETATHVVALAKPLGISFDDRGAQPEIQTIRPAMSQHLAHVISTDGDAVDAPPAPLAQWLTQHAADIRALQQQLVTHDAPQWAVDADTLVEAPMPRLVSQMDLFRVFALDALEQHRAGNDALAWEDQHASWKLAQGLAARPELISQLIGIAGARLANGVAAKLSAPAPAWRSELASFDFGNAAVASLAYDATHSWRYVRRYPAGEPDDDKLRNRGREFIGIILAPYRRHRSGIALEQQRHLAMELASLRACDPHPHTPPGTPNLAEAWRRIGRFRAEVEGVEKLLALKAARARSGTWPESMPSIAGSSCSDGSWQYQRAANGSMSLAFSKPIPVAHTQTTVVPLVFRYGK